MHRSAAAEKTAISLLAGGLAAVTGVTISRTNVGTSRRRGILQHARFQMIVRQSPAVNEPFRLDAPHREGAQAEAIIRGAMEDRVLFGLIWRLAMQQHQLLHEVLPIAQEMGTCLRGDVKPEPEQVRNWLAVEHKVHRTFGQLSEEIAGIQQMVQRSPYKLDV